jgi:excisionase family DNA binding protein
MVTPDEAAQLCRVSTRTIYRRIETGRLHFTETDRGFSLVCIQSLENGATATQEDTVETASDARGFFRKSMRRMLKRP